MRNYVSLQPQRDRIYEAIKDIAKSRRTVIELSKEDSDVSLNCEAALTSCESRLIDCLNDLGDMIGFTIMSDVIGGKEVKL